MGQKITGGTSGIETESPVTVTQSALMKDKTVQKPVVSPRKSKRKEGRYPGRRK